MLQLHHLYTAATRVLRTSLSVVYFMDLVAQNKIGFFQTHVG